PEIIIVRSLAESDLGLFAAHREAARSKQRALNINSEMARLLLARQAYDAGGTDLKCVCKYGSNETRGVRRLGKSGKNWRLGGKKIEGQAFAELDCKDFVLIRTKSENDGTDPVTMIFISKKRDRVVHAGLAIIIERHLDRSMAAFKEGEPQFADVVEHCARLPWDASPRTAVSEPPAKTAPPVSTMPKDESSEPKSKPRTIREKIRNTHLLEQMLKVAGDLSAPAQLRFLETVDRLATQLRELLVATGGIIRVDRNHGTFWPSVRGQRIGFVDGGLANLSMLGSAPIAARVGGYTVIPGDTGPNRESFIDLKHLIDELYAHAEGGVYSDSFPDVGALRDAARISIEAAGAVKLLSDSGEALKWLFLHGALVNPVSRYTDVMREGRIVHPFPDFS